MGARGVLFALTAAQERRLRKAAGDDDAVIEVIEQIEEVWDEANLVETDKAWDAIHRALTDGQVGWANGEYPLNHVILGGEGLFDGEDYIAVLKTDEQVLEIADALAGIDDARMAALYDAVVPSDYAAEYGPEDRADVVDGFRGVRDFYQRAADGGRAVLFTADQ